MSKKLKITFLILFVIFISGCSGFTPEEVRQARFNNYKKYNISQVDIKKLEKIERDKEYLLKSMGGKNAKESNYILYQYNKLDLESYKITDKYKIKTIWQPLVNRSRKNLEKSVKRDKAIFAEQRRKSILSNKRKKELLAQRERLALTKRTKARQYSHSKASSFESRSLRALDDFVGKAFVGWVTAGVATIASGSNYSSSTKLPQKNRTQSNKNKNNYKKIRKSGKTSEGNPYYYITCNNGAKQKHYVKKGYWYIGFWSTYTPLATLGKTNSKSTDYSPEEFANKVCPK